MSYLLDRKIKRRRFIQLGLLLAVLATIFYFRSGIFWGLSYATHIVFRPVLILGGSVGEKIKNAGSFFASKNSLQDEINNLQSRLALEEGRMSNYQTLLAENISLKEILGRVSSKGSPCCKMILAAILSKPNLSPYDTLVIDIGTDDGVERGDIVFALGNVPLGTVADTFPKTSKVVLFSSAGVKTQVVIDGDNTRHGGQVFLEIVGRGGGNFEMILPRDFTPQKGDEVTIPGIMAYMVAKVETTISDPREPFVKALLVSPVNIQDLKFVQVELK